MYDVTDANDEKSNWSGLGQSGKDPEYDAKILDICLLM